MRKTYFHSTNKLIMEKMRCTILVHTDSNDKWAQIKEILTLQGIHSVQKSANAQYTLDAVNKSKTPIMLLIDRHIEEVNTLDFIENVRSAGTEHDKKVLVFVMIDLFDAEDILTMYHNKIIDGYIFFPYADDAGKLLEIIWKKEMESIH